MLIATRVINHLHDRHRSNTDVVADFKQIPRAIHGEGVLVNVNFIPNLGTKQTQDAVLESSAFKHSSGNCCQEHSNDPHAEVEVTPDLMFAWTNSTNQKPLQSQCVTQGQKEGCPTKEVEKPGNHWKYPQDRFVVKVVKGKNWQGESDDNESSDRKDEGRNEQREKLSNGAPETTAVVITGLEVTSRDLAWLAKQTHRSIFLVVSRISMLAFNHFGGQRRDCAKIVDITHHKTSSFLVFTKD
mmetsp:Transcript_14493/g.20553  ORF Transcript_14493/g.20553 Transcript_14493/m.20553 type:complete len:242 (-) Transcript_14493:3708-4433(-)